MSFAYRWLRDGWRIPGAVSRRYRVRTGDRGHRLRCRVTARNAAGSSVAVSRRVPVP